MYFKRFYIEKFKFHRRAVRYTNLSVYAVLRRVEGRNEERIENDDLWGVCRCWSNNIIVNFADCGIVGVQGGEFIEQHGANARIMRGRLHLFTPVFVVVHFQRADIPILEGERETTPKMRKELPAVSAAFCSRRIKGRLKSSLLMR